MLLPKKVGSFTLMRRLDGGRNSEAYVAILEEPAGKQVVARRVAPAIARDPSQRAFIESRVRDLMTVRHPSLVPVLDAVATDTDLWVLEEWSESVSLRTVIKRASREKLTMPHNVFLNVATQICNGLEALHGRRAATTGAEHILHLALSPEAVRIDPSGRVQLGRFGLTRSPIPNSGSSTNQDVSDIVRYLSPEQTQPDPRLSPASDIFSLGIVLYELLVLKAMFEAEGTLQIIQQIRRAEVTTQLLEVKEALPGLDRVLFRALSLNPRHRYQRAFVLREDLRGLMAGFSFADIDEVSRAFFGPVFVEDDRLSDDFGESTPTHVGPLPEVKKRPDLRPKTFAPEFDEEPPPRPPKPPEERLSARATPRPAPQAPNRTPPKSAPVQRAPTPRPTPAKRAAPAAPPASRSVPQPPARSARPAPPRMAPPLQSAVAEDEEPTIGPGSLTLETLKEQLSFDDVHRRPLDDDERLLFENSDTHLGRDDERGDDAPTEFARVVRDDAGGFVVENGLGAPVVSPEPAWSGEPSFTNGEDAADPDSWNPRADVEPNVDWKDRPAWRGGPGPLDQGLGETQDPVTMTTRGHTGESPGFRDSAFNNPLGTTDFENFVDEDEVDTREHAATLWEREGTDEEPADDPATAWKPGLALEDSIRVFDDPTFDAGVDAGFDGVEEVNDDATMNLPRAAELPSGGFGNDPAPLGRSAPPLPPRDFAATDDPQDRTMEARSPLPELPPRSMSRSPSSAFPIDPAVPSSPPNGRGGTLVPPSFDERPSGFEPAPVPIGNPAMQEPTAQLRDFSPREAPGPSREDILRGRLVSDDVEDEDAEAGISWRVVFAAVAVMGFIGAVSVVGIVVYVAQQPFAQELFAVGAPHGDNEAFEVVERFDDPPEEAEPAPEEAEPEAAAEDEEVEVEAKLAEIAAEAVVKTELDPSQTFEGMKELDPEPVPAPAPPPPPPPAPEPKPEPVPETATRALDPLPQFIDDEPERKRNRRKERDREPEPDPARLEFEPPPPPVESEPAADGAKIASGEMDRWSKSAFEGRLSPGSAERLAGVEIDDPQFTRARTLLYLNAKKRGQLEEQRGHLRLLMSVPENQYNPVLLVEHARDAIEQKQYGEALKRAQVAEQHWARMPSSLVFTRKALIYEIEANAHTGLFFASEGRDANELRGAIRGWEKFQRHVARKGRNDMASRAEEQLQRLRELEERLK